jgi:hypothetical protein
MPSRADVLLRIENGQVSLKATNATVRDILAEWARIGQTKIVNGDRIPGGPVSLELNGVTEEQALEVILRSVAGYVVAPRTTDLANASRYDRILVMPTSSPTRSAPPPQPSFGQPGFAQPAFGQPGFGQPGGQPGFPQPGAQPAFQPPQFPQPVPGQFPPQFQRPVDDDVDSDVIAEPPPNPLIQQNPALPVFGAPPPPGTRPVPGQMPVGVAVPGMVVPTPQPQPGQPGAVQRPNDP